VFLLALLMPGTEQTLNKYLLNEYNKMESNGIGANFRMYGAYGFTEIQPML
jgi:hypothetical protein